MIPVDTGYHDTVPELFGIVGDSTVTGPSPASSLASGPAGVLAGRLGSIYVHIIWDHGSRGHGDNNINTASAASHADAGKCVH